RPAARLAGGAVRTRAAGRSGGADPGTGRRAGRRRASPAPRRPTRRSGATGDVADQPTAASPRAVPVTTADTRRRLRRAQARRPRTAGQREFGLGRAGGGADR